jgi:hypothetical protein
MLQHHEDGVIIIKRFFEPSRIHAVREAAKDIFKIQFHHFGYTNFDDDVGFKNAMVRLFNEQFAVFQNCGKLVQSGMIELYHLAYDQGLIDKLKELGLSHPLVCTRPVLFFNHPQLAKEVHYYKTPIHQDWQSMLSSADSVVVWIPLVDVDKDNGAVIFYPGTHKLGPLPYDTVGGFANIRFDRTQHPAIQPELEAGDIAVFSTLLVHESGDIDNDNIRWSCHFRYTNMLDQDFIDRGFPSPYLYKSTATQQ